MALDFSKISFVPTSIKMPYHGMSYQYCFAPYVNFADERDEMLAWYDNTRLFTSYGSLDYAILKTVSEIYVDDIQWFFAYGMDTSRLATWLRMRDLLVCATFVTVYPVRDKELLRASSMVQNVAFLLECLTHVADGQDVSWMFRLDDKERYGTSSHIFYDIVMGRSAAWLRYVIDCGATIAAFHGFDYMQELDAFGQERMGRFIASVVTRCEMDVSTASSKFAELCIRVSEHFDTRQCKWFSPKILEMPDVLVGARNMFVWDKYRDVYACVLDDASYNARGWCGVFGVDPSRCMWVLNNEFESIAAKTYYDVYMANLAVSRQEIDISGLV